MYNKNTEYNVKYVTKDGKEETKQITPEEDMSKPQMIIKLKEEDKNFFKLLEDFEYITPEELKKLHKDYKSTVGDIIRFSKYRGEDPEEVRQRYKDLGYDETDPMIVTSDGKGGTILKPVKVKKEESKMSKTLFDYLEEHSFEGVDIQDTVYDMTCWFEFTIEDADSDPFDMFMSKLAKSLHIDFEDVNKTVVVDLTNWVTKNYDKLEEIFDLSGEDKESNIEEIVGSIMPGLLSGYTTNSVYKELADNMIVESKEDEDEFEELENLDEEKPLTETTNKEIQKMKQDLYARERQALKDLGDENWENLVGLRGRMPEEMLNKFLEEREIINTIEMIHSILTYTSKANWNVDYVMNNKYMQSHVKELGEEKVKELAEQEIEEYKQATINKDVYTDSEDVSYNSVTFKDDVNESKIVENNSSLDGEDLTNTFKNYKAFEANFGPIKIVKNSYDKNYKVYKVNEEDAGNYIYYSDNKDNIEGWLYGAVQAANGKFNKLKNKNENVNKSILNEETSNSYTAISYYDDKLKGVEDETSSGDWSVITDFAHDKLMSGSYVKITNTTTGKEKVISPDTYQDDFDGEFVIGIEELDESVGDKSQEETLDEVINRAHQEEISAIDTYDTVLSKTDESTDAKLIEMINEIKKDEEDHKTLLQHYIETGEVWTDEDLEKENSEELEESKECIKEELPKQAPLDSLLDMVTEATNITELEEIADSILDSELKEDLLECIDDEDAKAYGEDIYFNTVKLNMQNIIEDYMDEQ